MMATRKSRHRFQDRGTTLSYYANRIFVRCPKCDQRAVVSTDHFGGPENPAWGNLKLTCPNCSYQEVGRPQRYDLSVRANCPNCGMRNEIQQVVPEKKERIAVQCRACGESEVYEPRYSKHYESYSGSSPVDPHYGLPLWIQGRFRNDVIWAYNYEHLAELKHYVGAKLRTRVRPRWFFTMVEKLPRWMTAKQNREGVLRVIRRLERR